MIYLQNLIPNSDALFVTRPWQVLTIPQNNVSVGSQTWGLKRFRLRVRGCE